MCMRVLPNIELNLAQMCFLSDQHPYRRGKESILYQLPFFEENTLAKIWESDILEDSEMENKCKKVNALYQLEILEEMNHLKILKSISFQKKVIGYLISRFDGISLEQVSATRKEKLDILIKVRKRLQQFQKLGIIYGDIKSSNILVGTDDICICDLDNIWIQGLDMDVYPNALDEFISNYGKLDEKAMSYMFNLLTLKELCSLEENRLVEEYLESEQIPREFEPRTYLTIRDQMCIVTPEYEGLYLTDYVKPKYKSIA